MNNLYINYLKGTKMSENTIKSYTSHVEEMLNYISKNEKEITYSDLMNWQFSISHMSASTVNLKISSVQSYFNFLTKIGEIQTNPASSLERVKNNQKEKQHVSSEDMKLIIKNMYTTEGKAIVALMAATGLRYSEMANITLEQYYNALATDSSIIILGKGNKERKIYINETVKNYINIYLSKNYKDKSNSDKLFVNTSASALRKSLIRAATKANLPYASSISPHWLRVFCATNAVEHGVDLGTVRDVLGHSNIAITSRYIKSCDKTIKNVMTQDMIFGG